MGPYAISNPSGLYLMPGVFFAASRDINENTSVANFIDVRPATHVS